MIVLINGQEFIVTTCCACAVTVLLPQATYKTRFEKPLGRACGRSFWCSNGHSFHFPGESDEEKIRRLRERLAQKDAEINDAHAAAEKAEAAAKRLKKRVSAGTCPACKRTFGDVAAHMRTKHPAFACEVVPLRKGA